MRLCEALRQAAFAVHFNVFRFFSDLSAIHAVYFFCFFFVIISNICICVAAAQRLRRLRRCSSTHVSRFHSYKT